MQSLQIPTQLNTCALKYRDANTLLLAPTGHFISVVRDGLTSLSLTTLCTVIPVQQPVKKLSKVGYYYLEKEKYECVVVNDGVCQCKNRWYYLKTSRVFKWLSALTCWNE